MRCNMWRRPPAPRAVSSALSLWDHITGSGSVCYTGAALSYGEAEWNLRVYEGETRRLGRIGCASWGEPRLVLR
jgi:hypothetical protein